VSEVKEIKLKVLTHKNRKEYSAKMREINKMKDDILKFESLMEFRENFLKEHIEGPIDLDELPATEVDDLMKKLEGDMDFQMGLGSLMSLNTPLSQEKPVIQKQEKP